MGLENVQWGPVGSFLKNMFCVFRDSYYYYYFYGTYVQIICLKAPGNYSDQLWSNKILVLLGEGPTPNIFMISGFLSPGVAFVWI